MSKPDRQLTLVETFRYYRNGELNDGEALDSVKALMLELIGDTKKQADYTDNVEDVYYYMEQLEKKVNEL